MFVCGPNKGLVRQGGSRSLGREREPCASEPEKEPTEKGGSLGQGHRNAKRGPGAGWEDWPPEQGEEHIAGKQTTPCSSGTRGQVAPRGPQGCPCCCDIWGLCSLTFWPILGSGYAPRWPQTPEPIFSLVYPKHNPDSPLIQG